MGGRGASSAYKKLSKARIERIEQLIKQGYSTIQAHDIAETEFRPRMNEELLRQTDRRANNNAVSQAGNLTTLQNQYDKLVARNTKLYNDNNGFAITGDMKRLEKRNKAYKEWLDNRTKLGELNQKINGLREINRGRATQQNNTFVNSYGEATRRNITNTTYERGQRRLEQQVRRNMGL